ncbi:hypothetical protein BT96DRAFT_936149 [Gymnopus androsaceus JB14]|uniref:Uncharacterized protein n=1 Tax=Gymnopus androsaceus JB14 TaxID=1447944 RepID=A0A6A4I3G2_9AGAR|nr:hypothetical protein BT96DRAFT_936149 [Gymnopus androsaceus JB14]
MVVSIIYLNCTDPVSIGIERDHTAHRTWQYLVKKYEACDKQQIHLTDTALCAHKFNPDTSTMEEHEKKMKNLLKTLHNPRGACNDHQFRLIVIASIPKTWKDYILNVPGIFSAESNDRDGDIVQNKVAALFAEYVAAHSASTTAASTKGNQTNLSAQTRHAPPRLATLLRGAGLKKVEWKARLPSPGGTSTVEPRPTPIQLLPLLMSMLVHYAPQTTRTWVHQSTPYPPPSLLKSPVELMPF